MFICSFCCAAPHLLHKDGWGASSQYTSSVLADRQFVIWYLLIFNASKFWLIFNLKVALDLLCNNCCCKIWLIFNLFIPFAEVLLHTYMDNLRYSFNYIPLPASYFPPTLENITYVYFQNLENTGYILQSSPPHFKWTIIYPSQRHIFLLLWKI